MPIAEHINEAKLELFIIGSKDIAADRDSIENHLAACPGCRELYDEMASFYAEVDKDFSASENLPVVKPHELTADRRSKLQREYWEYLMQKHTDLPFAHRAARWIIRHPYMTGSASILFAGLLIGAVLTLFNSPETKPKDLNPVYAEPAGEMLIVKNKYGQILDEINLGVDEVNRIKSSNHPLASLKTVVFSDVDGDGAPEIIWSTGNKLNEITPNLVFCKSIIKNKMLWIDTLQHRLSYALKPEIRETAFERSMLIAGDADGDKNAEVYIIANHQGYFASIIRKVDGKTGRLMDIYHHPGTISHSEVLDLEDDGIKEIIATGINNSYREACIMVFDPRFVSGQAPSTDEHRASGFGNGLQRAYIKIPKTILAESFKGQVYWNSPGGMITFPQEKKFKVSIHDMENADPAEKASYHLVFDRTLRAHMDNTGDDFDLMAKKLFRNHSIPFIPDSVYWGKFIHKIRYWDGAAWQNHPVENKYYLEAVAKLK